ncbi:MAG: RNA methyltransferase [Alphaproteobacteria bacterium]
MSGTDSSRTPVLGGPTVILVRPQLGENIGAAARAMLNGGLEDLRIVEPRDGWPNPVASANASGASAILDGARIEATVGTAIGDLVMVYAVTARPRSMIKAVDTPRQAMADLRRRWTAGERVGLLFGPERVGLLNDEVSLADRIVTIPLNPAFSSMNLAHSVAVMAYEWFQSGLPAAAQAEPRPLGRPAAVPASKADLMALFAHLEAELDACGFLFPPEKRATMVRNLRAILQRAELADSEVKTLRGVIASLVKPPRPRRAPETPTLFDSGPEIG